MLNNKNLIRKMGKMEKIKKYQKNNWYKNNGNKR